MRRRRNPGGQTTARKTTWVIAARHGLLLRRLDSITWNTETFAQNQNANAIRWGTLYNFRFDADQPPQNANATVDFFKTGSPMTVAIQAPTGGATPTPTPTRNSNSNSNAWTDSAQSPGEKGGGNKYIASQMEGGDLGQRRRLPRWSCDRDNAERWFV